MKTRNFCILAVLASSLYAKSAPVVPVVPVVPTQTELDAALANARAQWNAEGSEFIEFRLDPLNSCNLNEVHDIALTQSFDTVTTLSFDDAPPEVSHKLVWVIRINSNCDWSRLNLKNTVTHELGHILISPMYHSKNKKSVMFPLVQGAQSILPEDRALMVAALADLQK
jgi:hypothetical protein